MTLPEAELSFHFAAAAQLKPVLRPAFTERVATILQSQADPGPGDVDRAVRQALIGLQQISELMSNPEVEVIGMLPAELQQITIYSAGVTTSAREAAAAKALITALTAPSAATIYNAKGLDPAW